MYTESAIERQVRDKLDDPAATPPRQGTVLKLGRWEKDAERGLSS